MTEVVVIVPGDPEYSGTCITDDARPDLSHCWMRARDHIFHCKTLPYFVALEAAMTCRHVAEGIQQIPGRLYRPPIKWGWGKGWPGQ
jgi:hypothetical protein